MMPAWGDEGRMAKMKRLLASGLALRLFSNDVAITDETRPQLRAKEFASAADAYAVPAYAWITHWTTNDAGERVLRAEVSYTWTMDRSVVLRGWYLTLDDAFVSGGVGFAVEGSDKSVSPLAVRPHDKVSVTAILDL